MEASIFVVVVVVAVAELQPLATVLAELWSLSSLVVAGWERE